MMVRQAHWSLGWWRTVASVKRPESCHGCQSPWAAKTAIARTRTAMLMCPVMKSMMSMGVSLLSGGDDDGDEERGHGPVADERPCPYGLGVPGGGVDGDDPEDADRGRP